MNPIDIVKLIDQDRADDVVCEQLEGSDIIRGDGPFNIYFNRGTVVRVDHIAVSNTNPSLFYAGIDPSGFCFKRRNMRTVPLEMILTSDKVAARNMNINFPPRCYAVPYKRMITFNSKNVLKIEKTE
jgi:hypothetical protein